MPWAGGVVNATDPGQTEHRSTAGAAAANVANNQPTPRSSQTAAPAPADGGRISRGRHSRRLFKLCSPLAEPSLPLKVRPAAMSAQGVPVRAGECVHADQVSVDFAAKAEDPILAVAGTGGVPWPRRGGECPSARTRHLTDLPDNRRRIVGFVAKASRIVHVNVGAGPSGDARRHRRPPGTTTPLRRRVENPTPTPAAPRRPRPITQAWGRRTRLTRLPTSRPRAVLLSTRRDACYATRPDASARSHA
jgi:hypothetical protein